MTIVDELLKIKGKRSAIGPDDVVTWAAKHRDSELHKSFESRGLWDDATAAEIARREYGRSLIQRYRVNVIAADGKVHKVRGVVSLTEERRQSGGSYSLRCDVMSDAERLAMLRRDCARDIEAIGRRYVDILTSEQLLMLARLSASVTAPDDGLSGGGHYELQVAAQAAT